MVLCDGCNEWFHFDCVGITAEAAQGDDNWRCGYCRGQLGPDGKRVWNLPVPQGKRKRQKVAPTRSDADTPKQRGVNPENNEELVGPASWEDIVSLAREGGRKINEKEAKLKRRAAVLVKEGGHHVVDEMALGGVAARGVDNILVDDFLGLGMLEDDDEGELADDDDGHNV